MRKAVDGYVDGDGNPVTLYDMECGETYYRESDGYSGGLTDEYCASLESQPGEVTGPGTNPSANSSRSDIIPDPYNTEAATGAASDWTNMIGPTIGIVIGAFILGVLIWQTFFLVQTNEVAVVERFGRFLRMGKAGLNIKIPFVDQVVSRLNLRVMQLDEQVSTITEDKVSVRLNVSVQYQVDTSSDDVDSDPELSLFRAHYSLDDVESQITSYIFDAVRSTVPGKTLDEVFAEKDHIADSVNQQLSHTMDEYGYTIIRTLVTGVTPDGTVEEAMNQINATERLKQAATNEAEAYRIKIVGQAQGDSAAKELSGQGVAKQRKAIAEGLAEQHKALKEAGVENADIVLLMNQYLDTMQNMAADGEVTTVFLPGGADGVGVLENQLRNGLLTADAAKS